jgi:hypothetical protein
MMMSTLEHQIIELFHQLDHDAQQRVRASILQTTDEPPFDYDAWFYDIESLRQEIHAGYGDQRPTMDVIGMLRDIRDGKDE